MTDKLFYTVIITSLLIAVIIVFFVVSVVRYHRRYIRLQKERIEAEILMQEQERKRVANDLHDSLGPLLSTVKLYLHSIAVSNQQDKELLGKASNYIDETITSLREISYNLLPSGLSRKGLAETLKEYIYRITSRNVLKIDFTADENLNINQKIEIHLFRILHEIIHNTIKHAKAQTLHLLITSKPDGLVILTEDDGLGFDVEDTRDSSAGLGLKSMESRCELIGASLQIISEKGKGCKIIIKIPHS
jgi:signal transduction histidine kinase